METKMTTAPAEARDAFGEMLSAFESFKATNDQRLAEIEARAASDILLEEKLARIDTALNQHKSALDRLRLEALRPDIETETSGQASGFNHYMRTGDVSALGNSSLAVGRRGCLSGRL